MPALATETLAPRMSIMAGLSGGSAAYLRPYPIFSYTTIPSYNISSSGNSSTSFNNNSSSGGYDVPDNKTNELQLPHFTKHIYRMNDIFHREDERVKTFDSWPLEWLDKFELARTGMFYTGEADKVKCYFCEVEIGRWEEQDLPVPEHMRWSPNCPLLRRRTTNNAPIDVEALDRALPPVSYDICGGNDAIEVRPFAYAEGTINMPRNNAGNTAMSTAAAAGSSSAGPTSCAPSTYYIQFPEYAIEAARLRSFAEWPRHMKQKPEQLSEAGFFYTGLGDRVKCFSCGGGLKDWDEGDEPWEQHALWLNKCRYLSLMKGQCYVESVIAKHKAKQEAEAEEKPPADAAAAMLMRDCVEVTACSVNCDVAPASSQQTSKAAAEEPEQLSAAAAEKKAAAAANSSIPEEKLCKICYAGEYNTAFLPCGHVVACAKCASSVTKCPLCRKPFTDVMRVYFS